jgi:MFS family permease
MNLLMAATPLAMQICGLPFSDTALVLEWHVIGMFAPCLVTGHLIKRLGSLNVIYLGALLYLAGIAAMYAFVYVGFDFSVEEMNQFLFAMFLLGLGWNFLFTGSTSMTIQAYTNEEKTRAQAAINFCVFVTMAIFTFAPALLMKTIG